MRGRRKPRFGRASKPRKVGGVKNATEREYEDLHLRARQAAGEVVEWWYERWTFKLADDTRYTPDYVVLLASGELEVVEVKGGHIWEDGKVKPKVAAEMIPLRFWLAQKMPKKHGGNWQVTEITGGTWAEAA